MLRGCHYQFWPSSSQCLSYTKSVKCSQTCLIMVALWNRADHYISALWFLLFFPRLISAIADWMSAILPHMRISDAGLKRAAHGSLQIQDAKKSSSAHHRTTLSGYIFATKARIDNREKNLLSSNISSRCPHNMVNFGPLAAEIDPIVWGISANFNGFCVLAALLHGTPVVGISQTLRHWTEGATYVRQGDHHVGH